MTLTLRSGQILPITPHDVAETLGIPLRDVPVVIPAKQKGIQLPTKHEYQKMSVVVGHGPTFDKTFIMTTFLTVLTPISRQDGTHELCGWIKQNGLKLHRFDWAGYVFDKLREGISQWQLNEQSINPILNECLLFLE